MNEMQDEDAAHGDKLRDPEDRPITSEQELREKMLDKTLADSFPPATLHQLFQIPQAKILCD